MTGGWRKQSSKQKKRKKRTQHRPSRGVDRTERGELRHLRREVRELARIISVLSRELEQQGIERKKEIPKKRISPHDVSDKPVSEMVCEACGSTNTKKVLTGIRSFVVCSDCRWRAPFL